MPASETHLHRCNHPCRCTTDNTNIYLLYSTTCVILLDRGSMRGAGVHPYVRTWRCTHSTRATTGRCMYVQPNLWHGTVYSNYSTVRTRGTFWIWRYTCIVAMGCMNAVCVICIDLHTVQAVWYTTTCLIGFLCLCMNQVMCWNWKYSFDAHRHDLQTHACMYFNFY